MNPDLFAAWIAALSSGEYPKGRDCLRCHLGWRAFGVLLDVIDKSQWKQDRWGLWHWDGSAILLPQWVQDRVGLDARSTYQLDRLDEGAATFNELAKVLKQVVNLDSEADRRPSQVVPVNLGRKPMPLKMGRPPAKRK